MKTVLFLSLFFSVFLSATENEKLFASSDLWSSVATRGVRSSHSMNTAQVFFEDSERGFFSFDLFLQTSWGLSGNFSFFKDVINLDKIKSQFSNLYNGLSHIPPVDLNFSVDKFSDFLKKITIEEALAGMLMRFSQNWFGFVFGMDIPIIYKLKHPWVNMVEEDYKLINDLQVAFDENPAIEELKKLVTHDDKVRLVDLFNNTKKMLDFGLGDIRLYCERCFFRKKQATSSTTFLLGGEFLLPIKKLDNSSISSLRADRPKLTQQYLIDLTNKLADSASVTDILSGQLFSEAKKRVIGLVENIFLTIQESALRPLIDEQRPGVGLYLKPMIQTHSKKVSIFGKIKSNYFFETIGSKVFTTSDDGQFETSKLKANLSPLKHFQGVVGLLFKPNIFFYGIGYEFFSRSEESIINVLDAKDDNSVDFSKNINKERSQNFTSQQHKFFSSIGINTTTLFNSFHFMLTGNYCFSSTGTFGNNWGISLSTGISF